jgi:hypothetical protein
MAAEGEDFPSDRDSRFDDPQFCLRWLTEHADSSVPDPLRRHCIVTIASTYLDGDENSITPDEILFAPTVKIGTLGNAPELHASTDIRENIRSGRTAEILRITNRQWTVDGNVAFVVYDGYLRRDPSTPSFFVAERFTIENGLIAEIFIAGVKSPEQTERPVG